MSQRRIHSAVAGTVCVAVLASAVYSAGIHQGITLRTCPAKLDDGRPLLGIVLATNECKYAGPPRPLVEVSSIELRRMATMRDRLEKTKP